MNKNRSNRSEEKLRPYENNEIPIQFIDIEEKIAGWSPKLKRTLYLDPGSNYDPGKFKRARDIFLLKVYSCILESTIQIELSLTEKLRFEDVLNDMLLFGGEIMYMRRKEGRRSVNIFRLEQGEASIFQERKTLEELL